MREKNPDQIIRIDGQNVFFEVMSSSFAIGKVNINFIKYDPAKNNAQTSNIKIYMDMDRFLALANMVTSGQLDALAAEAKQEHAQRLAAAKKKGEETKYIYCKEVFLDDGGTSAQKVRDQIARAEANGTKRPYNFEVPEGSAVSRQMKITPGSRFAWVLSAHIGLGKETETGLIVMDGRPKENVLVPLSDIDLKRFVLITQAHIQGYINAKYVSETAGEQKATA